MLSRRALLGTSLFAGVRRLEAARLSELDLKMPLEERIRRIQSFVHERYYDDKGILQSHWNFAEERPLRREDFHPDAGSPVGVRMADWMNYENSSMVSGIFLASQCYRYQATREPQALEYCERAFRSIDAIFRLAEGEAGKPPVLMQRAGSVDPNDRFESRPGWICKPYAQSLTMQTSTEQNFGPMWGLFLYRAHAPAAIKQRIEYIVTSVATLWRQNRYTINFLGENWALEQSMPRAQRHMPVWMLINRMAFELSGDPAFKKEFERLRSLFGSMPTARETNWAMGRPKYISTEDRAFHDKEVVTAEFLMDFDSPNRARYHRAMEAWWEFSKIGMRPDLFSYYFIELDAETGEWTPLKKSVKPRSLWTSGWMLQNATFPICWGEIASRRTLSSAMVARRGGPKAEQAKQFALEAFGKLDKGHLRYMIDPENSLEPELAYLTNLLSGDSMAYFPAAYWYGRLHRLWA